MTTASHRPLASRLRAAVLGLALGVGAAGLVAPRADAASAALAKDGSLYEVFATSYGEVIPGASAADAGTSVIALRTTLPGQAPTVEIVGGTVNSLRKFGESLEYDDSTRTVFIVYTSLEVQGFFADIHVAMLREGAWSVGRFLPNPGQFFSVNPRLLVTRQTYTDFGDDGEIVQKARAILSLVWWEESALSQARYAALFIEDGALKLDDVVAMNLNELANAAGPTDNRDLPHVLVHVPRRAARPFGRTAACSCRSRTSRPASSRSSASDSRTTSRSRPRRRRRREAAPRTRARPRSAAAAWSSRSPRASTCRSR